jgi:hypothetical protein
LRFLPGSASPVSKRGPFLRPLRAFFAPFAGAAAFAAGAAVDSAALAAAAGDAAAWSAAALRPRGDLPLADAPVCFVAPA